MLHSLMCSDSTSLPVMCYLMYFVDTTSTVHNFLRRAKSHFLRPSIFKLTEFVDQLMIFHNIFWSFNLREYSPGIEQSRISYFFSFKYINTLMQLELPGLWTLSEVLNCSIDQMYLECTNAFIFFPIHLKRHLPKISG